MSDAWGEEADPRKYLIPHSTYRRIVTMANRLLARDRSLANEVDKTMRMIQDAEVLLKKEDQDESNANRI